MHRWYDLPPTRKRRLENVHLEVNQANSDEFYHNQLETRLTGPIPGTLAGKHSFLFDTQFEGPTDPIIGTLIPPAIENAWTAGKHNFLFDTQFEGPTDPIIGTLIPPAIENAWTAGVS